VPPLHTRLLKGFLGREIIEDFDYFAKTCFDLFGDRVKKWIT
jgi:6-phospho-beta-glucosidase